MYKLRAMKKTIMILVTMVLALVTSVAQAGTLTVRDTTNSLSQNDIAALRATAEKSPFDLHVLFERTNALHALEADAHAWVDGPKVVVVGLDPVNHWIATRFGVGTGVKAADFDMVGRSGNAFFRSGEWRQGIEAITIRAQASSDAKVALVGSADPVVVQGGLSTGTWVGIGLLVALFGGLAIWLYRKSKADRERFQSVLDETREEAAELRHRNVQLMTLPEPKNVASVPDSIPYKQARTPVPAPYRGRVGTYDSSSHYVPAPAPAPAPAPVVVQQSGPDFTTGLLLGNALGSSSHHHDREVIVEREVVRPSYGRSRSSDSDYDSGGSGSSYSGSSSSYTPPAPAPTPAPSYTPSSSSSSYDSGGSSSSWGGSSSSSYDSGGGGSFDSGGGGGSFD